MYLKPRRNANPAATPLKHAKVNPNNGLIDTGQAMKAPQDDAKAPPRRRDDIMGEQLRANLARRKAQARARAEPATDPPQAAAPPDPDTTT
jgi:hypothetical protein